MMQLIIRVLWGQSTDIMLTGLHGFKDQGFAVDTESRSDELAVEQNNTMEVQCAYVHGTLCWFHELGT